MKNEIRRTFKRDLQALSEVADFIGAFAAAHQVAPTVRFSVDLAVEELFTNMIKFNPEGSEEIEIGLRKDDACLTVVLIDFVSEPFDLTRHEAADMEAALQDRRVGGLGIHLVRRMMDEVYYEYEARQSKITLVKKLTAHA